jgi:hypothetical protein
MQKINMEELHVRFVVIKFSHLYLNTYMEDYLKDKKFEAVKYRHEDQAKLLQYMTTIEHQLFRGFLTVQLVFGGFLTQFKVEDISARIGLFIIDLALAFVCLKLLHKSYLRRKEVQATIKNCNTALGFDQPDIYLKEPINATSVARPWFPNFFTGVVATMIGILLILFIPKGSNPETESKSVNVNVTIGKDTLRINRDTTIIIHNNGRKNEKR